MRKHFAVAMMVAALIMVGVSYAEDAKTITGEAADIACYLGGKGGEGHAACAKSCADKGNPLGIVSKGADGKDTVYLVLGGGGKAAKDVLGDLMGKQVTATGVVTEKGGMKVLTVAKVEAAKK